MNIKTKRLKAKALIPGDIIVKKFKESNNLEIIKAVSGFGHTKIEIYTKSGEHRSEIIPDDDYVEIIDRLNIK